MRRRVGHEARLVELRGQDVAATAAADQNLPAAVLRTLDEQRLGTLRGGKDRRERAGGACTDDDYAGHASSDWRNVRLKRPDNSSEGGDVHGTMRETP
jgi:hypothetical protein